MASNGCCSSRASLEDTPESTRGCADLHMRLDCCVTQEGVGCCEGARENQPDEDILSSDFISCEMRRAPDCWPGSENHDNVIDIAEEVHLRGYLD